jgi:hypothetical protein
VPGAYSVHVPSSPAALQAWQGPSHAVPQQTPSTQWLEAHSAARMQGLPAGSAAAQPEGAQYAPAAQDASRVHAAGHSPELPSHV